MPMKLERYVLFAKAHGHTPEAQYAHDKKAWPGGKMTGFLLWMNAAWPMWCAARGFKNQREAGMTMGAKMWDDFDAWLAENFEQIPKEEKSLRL